jgi:hypothetical protein
MAGRSGEGQGEAGSIFLFTKTVFKTTYLPLPIPPHCPETLEPSPSCPTTTNTAPAATKAAKATTTDRARAAATRTEASGTSTTDDKKVLPLEVVGRRDGDMMVGVTRPHTVAMMKLVEDSKEVAMVAVKKVVVMDKRVATRVVKTVEAMEVVKTVEAMEVVKTVEAMEVVKTVEAMEVVKTLEAMKIVKMVEATKAVNKVVTARDVKKAVALDISPTTAVLKVHTQKVNDTARVMASQAGPRTQEDMEASRMTSRALSTRPVNTPVTVVIPTSSAPFSALFRVTSTRFRTKTWTKMMR